MNLPTPHGGGPGTNKRHWLSPSHHQPGAFPARRHSLQSLLSSPSQETFLGWDESSAWAVLYLTPLQHPGVLLGMQPLDAPWGCSLPSLQLTRTAQRGQWQHGGGSQMCEWASVAQGKSQHRPCGQNPGIWVSPRHRSEGSGQGKQPGWLPTAPGEWDGGTEDG